MKKLLDAVLAIAALMVANTGLALPSTGSAATTSTSNSTVSCLKDSYAAFQQASDDDKKSIAAKYLDCFPSRFSDFETVFGYDSETRTEAPLYMSYSDHFDFIAQNYDLFDKKRFSEKFVSLASGATGRVFVDAEEMLQQTALAPIVRDPAIGLAVLSKHSDSEIEKFWYFVLDNVEIGTDVNGYSCPDSYHDVKACKILSIVKTHPRKRRYGRVVPFSASWRRTPIYFGGGGASLSHIPVLPGH